MDYITSSQVSSLGEGKRQPKDMSGIREHVLNSLRVPSKGSSVFVPNVLSLKEGQEEAGVIVPDPEKPLSDLLKNFVENSALRYSSLEDGNIVLSKKLAKKAKAHMEYLEEQGLVTEGAYERIVFVDDSTNLNEVSERLSDLGASAHLYFASAQAYEIFGRSNVAIDNFSAEVSEATIGRYRHKGRFRDEFGYDLPRLSIRKDQLKSYHYNSYCLEYALDAARKIAVPFKDGKRPILFFQFAESDGGVTNKVIFEHRDGSFSFDGESERYSGKDKLLFYIENLADETGNDIEVAPFVPRVKTYGFTIAISDGKVSVIGPIEQVLNELGTNYEGFRVSANASSSEYKHLDDMMKKSLKFALKLEKEGYRGICNIDIHEGEAVSFASEVNARRTAVTPTIALAMRHDSSARRFLFSGSKGGKKRKDGKLVSYGLAITESEYMYIHPSHVEMCGGPENFNTKSMMRLLRANDLSCFSRDKPFGFFPVTSPTINPKTGEMSAWMSNIAKSDTKRDTDMEKAIKILGSPAPEAAALARV